LELSAAGIPFEPVPGCFVLNKPRRTAADVTSNEWVSLSSNFVVHLFLAFSWSLSATRFELVGNRSGGFFFRCLILLSRIIKLSLAKLMLTTLPVEVFPAARSSFISDTVSYCALELTNKVAAGGAI
jgi:hypothetical protein